MLKVLSSKEKRVIISFVATLVCYFYNFIQIDANYCSRNYACLPKKESCFSFPLVLSRHCCQCYVFTDFIRDFFIFLVLPFLFFYFALTMVSRKILLKITANLLGVFVLTALLLSLFFGFEASSGLVMRIGLLKKPTELILKMKCRGANKFLTYYGMLKNPICATKYPDAGKTCNGGNDCQSGVCYMTFKEANKLIEERYGKDAIYREDIDILSIIIPDGSGKCKRDNVPDCFSEVQGQVLIKDRKMIDRVGFCD